MFTLRFQIAYLSAALCVFGLVAHVTRATARRAVGALCAALTFTVMSAPIDTLALRAGWWSYPSCVAPPHPPLAVYVGQALLFVGSVALIAWRVQRLFGTRGVAVLSAIVCVAGTVRDFAVAALLPGLIRFGPLPFSLLADMGAWAIVVVVALGITRVVAGPASADVPRGAPRARR